MKNVLRTLLLGAAGVAAGMGGANAADFEPFPTVYQDAPEMVPVEIGTGWYLRGDVSYQLDTEVDVKFSNDDFFPEDRTGTITLEEDFAFGGGVGYRFTDYFRGDVTANYSTNDIGDIGYVEAYGLETELESWELMGNAYVDLGTYVGFTPYVGAGVGGVHASFEPDCSFDGIDCADFFGEELDGSSDWRFAYSLMAGVSYDVSRSLKIDVGYKYLNVDEGDIMSADGFAAIDGDYADDGFDRHTIRAGFRYSLW